MIFLIMIPWKSLLYRMKGQLLEQTYVSKKGIFEMSESKEEQEDAFNHGKNKKKSFETFSFYKDPSTRAFSYIEKKKKK